MSDECVRREYWVSACVCMGVQRSSTTYGRSYNDGGVLQKCPKISQHVMRLIRMSGLFTCNNVWVIRLKEQWNNLLKRMTGL